MTESEVKLPSGNVAVTVKLINPVNFGPSILNRFMSPPVLGLETFKSAPSFSFLLEHPSGRKLIWDLGIRKDYENYSPSVAAYIPTTKYTIDIEEDVATTLRRDGVDLESVEAIIWSHWHWDHIGDPSTFPSSTDLIVGPGFKEHMLPGAPNDPQSPLQEADWVGRNLREITFEGPLVSMIGRFPAYDYFGDGSFFLLDSPGHAIGHLCGLVRTTVSPPSFILLGGDICHFAGIFRPSSKLPLPEKVSPNPCIPQSPVPLCPGAAWEKLQRDRGRQATDSLYDMTFGHDIPLATKTKDKLQDLDCHPDVFVIIAHDAEVRDGVDHFPASLNDWKAKGYGSQLKWAWLRHLRHIWAAKSG